MEQDWRPTIGRGSQVAGGRGGLCTIPWGGQRLTLSLLRLAAWKPQVSGLPRHLTCGLRKGTEGHEFMCPQHRRGGGKKKKVVGSKSLLPLRLCVGSGLCSQHLPEGQLGPSPDACGQSQGRFFSVLVPCPPLCLCPSAGIQVQTLCFEAVCASRRVQQTAGGQLVQLRRAGPRQGGLLVHMG